MADIISLTLTIKSNNGTINLNKDNQNTTITIDEAKIGRASCRERV